MERRQHERTSRSIRVEMTHPGIGTIVGFTTDISEGGAQVMLENQVLPPVGTVVQVLFRKVVGPINSEPVAMKVVRQFRNTIGLTFAT
ncbi:PilZ domain-containing protein [Gilvimarinus xylanilyticus]|uniref:PilZ domain-containing protein n=1 Tax=Gilvimarinus xylanilyticus TaxID=2944139 RepID=A0A9X2KTM0_9GAMM|nr:PilZ domain-containing protein [Gilvimarinus xylanilyticus]